MPLRRSRKPPRSTPGKGEIVIIDGDRAEAKKTLATLPERAVCIGLLGKDRAAYDLLDAGADMILHKPVFSEWAKVCLKLACSGK